MLHVSKDVLVDSNSNADEIIMSSVEKVLAMSVTKGTAGEMERSAPAPTVTILKEREESLMLQKSL